MNSVTVHQLIHERNSRFAQILREIRIEDSFYVKATANEPWGFDNPALKGCLFHFILEGSAQMEDDNGSFISLTQGDLILIPKGNRHILRSGSNALIETFETVDIKPLGENSSLMSLGGTGKRTSIICGGLTFNPSWHPLLEGLPSLIIQRHSSEETAFNMNILMQLMGSEVKTDMPGSEIVINRLNEVLVITALRNWMLNGIEKSSSWIYALRDQFLGHSLIKIHTSPERNWSVASLAKEAKMSRSVYAKEFHKLVGMPPMHYVTHLRMNLAADRLRQSNDTVECIAISVGYDSAVSFSRAFKRYWGEPPGKFKLNAQLS